MAEPQRKYCLNTQTDGRKYAVVVLARLDNTSRRLSDAHVICPFNPKGELGNRMNPAEYFRTGPQWDGFAKDVMHLFQAGTVEAQKGFLAVLTDCFAGAVNMDLDYYRDYERKGYLQDLGVRGDVMPLPTKGGTWKEIERLTGWAPKRAPGHEVSK